METNTARATHRGVVRRTRNVDDNVPAAGMLAEKFRDVVHDALDYEPAVGIGVVLRHLGERERLRVHPPSTCPLVLALHPGGVNTLFCCGLRLWRSPWQNLSFVAPPLAPPALLASHLDSLAPPGRFYRTLG